MTCDAILVVALTTEGLVVTEAVAILGGTGNLGFGLALRLADAGYSVVIGSRDTDKAKAAATRVAQRVLPAGYVRGLENSDAVTEADRLVIVTVPFASQASTLKSIAPSLRDGQIVLDATVPLATAVGGSPTQLLGPWAGSAGEQARAALRPSVGLVSGLHTLSASLLEDLEHGVDQDTLLCGDSADDKRFVAGVLERVPGLRVVDAGGLSTSRLVESLTPLLIGINIRNKVHAGIKIVGLA